MCVKRSFKFVKYDLALKSSVLKNIETALIHKKDLKANKETRTHTLLVLYYFSGAFLKKIIIRKYHTKFIHTLARDSQ